MNWFALFCFILALVLFILTRKNGAAILAALVALAVIFGISWGLTCLFVKLIFWCFGLAFTLQIATGIWLILILFAAAFNIGRKK